MTDPQRVSKGQRSASPRLPWELAVQLPVPIQPDSIEGERASTSLEGDALSMLYALERHRGTLEVLLLLYAEGTATRSRLRAKLRPGAEAIDGALAGLGRLGLITSDHLRTFPFTRTYRLTERGEELLDAPLRRLPAMLRR
jgi:DNA-binding HxlR family transcriptional regulator